MRMWVCDPHAGGVKIPKRVQERTKQRLEAYAETRSAPYRRWACMRCKPIWRSWKWNPPSSSIILAVESTGHRFNDRHRERARRRRGRLYSKGAYAYGGYPDIDELYQQQAGERDRVTREALLHRIQQLTVERVMFAPIFNFRGLHGVGPRVAEHTINAIPMHPFPSYEDVRLKGQ